MIISQSKTFVVPDLPMFHATIVIVIFLVVAWLFHAGLVSAADRLQPLTVGYSNFTGTYGPLWIAIEEHVGTKYGLDLKAIYAGRVLIARKAGFKD